MRSHCSGAWEATVPDHVKLMLLVPTEPVWQAVVLVSVVLRAV